MTFGDGSTDMSLPNVLSRGEKAKFATSKKSAEKDVFFVSAGNTTEHTQVIVGLLVALLVAFSEYPPPPSEETKGLILHPSVIWRFPSRREQNSSTLSPLVMFVATRIPVECVVVFWHASVLVYVILRYTGLMVLGGSVTFFSCCSVSPNTHPL